MALGPRSFFFVGMLLIVIGTGLLKPNISTMVGGLYSQSDPRRDAGFSVFYMGINLGALISPLVCGYLGQRVDWHMGFGAAGIGMSLGLVQFLAHRDRLAHVGNKPFKPERKGTAAAGGGLTAEETKRLAAIGILFVFSSLFWAAFEQAGSSLNLFADQVTDNRILGWEFPSSWFQAVNAIFLIALAPVFSWLWLRMGERQPSSPAKFSYGLLFVGLGFVLAASGASVANNAKVSPAWLIGVYFCNTIGELCLSPVGLSIVTKLAPARLVGLMMGVWFLSISTGNYLGGWIAGFFDAAAEGAMVRLFGAVAIGTLVAAGILAWLIPFIRGLMGRVR
jgi:POT family proton-dependent oligopeptide transporter